MEEKIYYGLDGEIGSKIVVFTIWSFIPIHLFFGYIGKEMPIGMILGTLFILLTGVYFGSFLQRYFNIKFKKIILNKRGIDFNTRRMKRFIRWEEIENYTINGFAILLHLKNSKNIMISLREINFIPELLEKDLNYFLGKDGKIKNDKNFEKISFGIE